ncbi:hypothetical protein COLO4_32180 [Corchorus olitorius]|uniref:Uncharacterized protein n=1 Tax=Corchorus olitorius TaxID=93759 RepID=A0A1R3H0L2_9ROSI|nr:hypothetical protein COLO4_32180 [Corchorus olitorius]
MTFSYLLSSHPPEIVHHGGAAVSESPTVADGLQASPKCCPSHLDHSADVGSL